MTKRKKDPRWFADDIKKRIGLSCDFGNSTCPGVCTIEARHAAYLGPIGTVWYVWRGKSVVEIVSSYVVNHYRRLGVRTFLHEKLLAAYPNKITSIITGEATKDSEPWLKKMGFKRNHEDGWRLKINS